MNKKGDKLLSFGWVFILVIVGAGVVFGVTSFFSAHIDVRQMESDVLNVEVFDCVSQGMDDFSEDNFFDKCGLIAEKFGEGSNYFILVNVDGLNYRYGKHSMEESCKISFGLLKSKEYPRCTEKSSGDIYILTGSSNRGGAVK